jgi:hypothetical protein
LDARERFFRLSTTEAVDTHQLEQGLLDLNAELSREFASCYPE